MFVNEYKHAESAFSHINPISLSEFREKAEGFILEATSENADIKLLKNRVSIVKIELNSHQHYHLALKVDLSSHPGLQPHPNMDAFENRNLNNTLVCSQINQFFILIKNFCSQFRPQCSFGIIDVDLSGNFVSGRSLLNGRLNVQTQRFIATSPEDLYEQAHPDYEQKNSILFTEIQRTIQFVKFNQTLLTNNGIDSLHRLESLKEVEIAFCLNSQHLNQFGGKIIRKMPTVKRVNIVGSPVSYSKGLLKCVQGKFPNIKVVEFTQPEEGKFLGLTDIITGQSIVTPCVLQCGHIYSKKVAQKQSNRKCFTCGKKSTKDPLTAAIFRTRLKKTRDRETKEVYWKIELLDIKSRPLSDRIFYHPMCREAFNFETLSGMAALDARISDVGLIDFFHKMNCPGCFHKQIVSKLELRRIYPVLTEVDDILAESQSQQSLAKVSDYLNLP